MKEIKAYGCDYCKKYSKSKSYIRTHENNCYHNEETRSCITCGNMQQESHRVEVQGADASMRLPMCTVGITISDINEYPSKQCVSLKTACDHWINIEDSKEECS